MNTSITEYGTVLKSKVEGWERIKVDSQEDEAVAVDALAVVQKSKRALERAKKELTTPLTEKLKRVRESYAIPIAHLVGAELQIKRAIAGWRQVEYARIEVERVRVAEENRRRELEATEREQVERDAAAACAEREALDAGYTPADALAVSKMVAEDVAPVVAITEVEPEAPRKVVTTELGSATSRTITKWKYTDEAAVPRAYCVPSSPLIWAAVRAGIANIPGVEVYKDIEISGKQA